MIFELGDFVGCELRCRERERAGCVTGFVIDGADWALRYVLVRLDRDPAAVRRLLPTAALPPVMRFDDHLTACLTPDEFAHGIPLAGACEHITRDMERSLHDALHWMPYWTQTAAHAACTLHDAGSMQGAPFSCCGEPAGRVDDLLVDTRAWTVPVLCIRTPGGHDERRLHLPTSFIRAVDWSAPSVDSDVRAAALACAPAAEEVDVSGSDYVDRLRQQLARH